MRGAKIVHHDMPIVPSPSGLPSQHLVTNAVGSQTLFFGQQWLEPGERVLMHTHPCEEALTFLAGSGEATIDGEIVTIGSGVSLYIPADVPHGFQNSGTATLHVLIVFPVPYFAPTTIIE